MLLYALYMLLFLYILGLKLENEWQGRLRLGTFSLSAVWAGSSHVTVPGRQGLQSQRKHRLADLKGQRSAVWPPVNAQGSPIHFDLR